MNEAQKPPATSAHRPTSCHRRTPLQANLHIIAPRNALLPGLAPSSHYGPLLTCDRSITANTQRTWRAGRWIALVVGISKRGHMHPDRTVCSVSTPCLQKHSACVPRDRPVPYRTAPRCTAPYRTASLPSTTPPTSREGKEARARRFQTTPITISPCNEKK
jgi:hypothetical protein